MQIKKELCRLTAKFKVKTIAGFDCETFGQKNDYFMNTFTYNDNDFIFYDKQKFIDFLIHKKDLHGNCMIFASNLMFDFFCIFNNTELQKKFKMLFRNGRLLKAFCYVYDGQMLNPNSVKETKHKHRKLEFYDTLNFLPASVETLGQVIDFPKMEKPDFLGEKPKTLEQKTYLERYCLRDSKITCLFMEFLQKNINDLGGKLRITIPSTAMDLYRRKFLPMNLKTPDLEMIKLMYKAYYGGRTEAFKRGLCASEETGIKPVNVYDINSLYPYCMKTAKYPNPNFIRHELIDIKDIDSYEGITEAVINMPYSHIPYLPLRADKLLFGYGQYKGWYSLFELREAIKLGANVTFCGKQIATDKLFNPFSEYVSKLWALRKKWKLENNPAELVAKLCLTSLYGKFGEKIIDRTDIEFIENMTKDKMRYNWKQGYKMEVVDDIVIIKKPVDKNFSAHVNPMLALYTTAFSRHELYKLINKKPENTFYCDTDSVFTRDKFETSTELGGLKLEYKFKNLTIVRPKFYSGLTYSAKEIVKIKGLSKIDTIKQFDLLADTKKYTYTKYMKFFESKRRKFLTDENGQQNPYDFIVNEKLEVPKTLSFSDTKRDWSKPFDFKALQESKPRLIQV